ncbi:Putative uncharacterized protein (plasmid) [Lactococcus lactis subsp. lactis]|jgi:hypothetical protein|nr:Putative uncharacterized protein [Lactococcus lactis subsp. lactis]
MDQIYKDLTYRDFGTYKINIKFKKVPTRILSFYFFEQVGF